MAQSSDKLDLSDCELSSIPEDTFSLTNLKELSLAGNYLTALPEAIGSLTALERLVIAGNDLKELPDALTALPSLRGLWAHGNVVEELPSDWSRLTNLRTLSFAGNNLSTLPPSMGNLGHLTHLNLAGNAITSLPDEMSNMQELEKLELHGNQLTALPASLGQLPKLEELKVMGNRLSSFPPQLLQCSSLVRLNISDNDLTQLPEDWSTLTKLRVIWLYGNQLTVLPESLAHLPSLMSIWSERNPFSVAGMASFLIAAAKNTSITRFGIDTTQLPDSWISTEDGAPRVSSDTNGASQSLKLGYIMGGNGRGYFKLQPGPGYGSQEIIFRDGTVGQRCLVVAFGSAPGDPSWGGVLSKVAATCLEPEHRQFDVLFVVDTARSWYDGGNEEVFQRWHDRLEQAVAGYKRVLMIGDSMGATAALLFSRLATAVIAFTPQVDLEHSSIRPGFPSPWRAALKKRLLSNIAATSAEIQVHSGTWAHDIEQANMLPDASVKVTIHYVDSHRLAYFLNGDSKLVPLIHDMIARQMGYETHHQVKSVRMSNIL